MDRLRNAARMLSLALLLRSSRFCVNWLCLLLFALLTFPDCSFGCPVPPEPIAEVVAGGFYSDPLGSIVDPQKLKAYQTAVAPSRQFYRHLVELLSNDQEGQCSCAINSLNVWAKANALRKVTSAAERRFAAAALVSAYLKGISTGKDCRSPVVEAWLGGIVRQNRPAHLSEERLTRSNNLDYWAAAGSAILDAITRANPDDRLFAHTIYNNAFATVDRDGLLRNERARGGRSWNYHFFSLTPLAIISSVVSPCGMQGPIDDRLDGLAGTVLDQYKKSLGDGLTDKDFESRFSREMPDVSRSWINLLAERRPAAFPQNLLHSKADNTWYLAGNVDRFSRALKDLRLDCARPQQSKPTAIQR